MYAMKIIPSFKDYLWGGKRLESEFGFKSGYEKTAEAWILSVHPDGDSAIDNGEYSGMTLRQVLSLHPEYIKKGYTGDLPILIKFIDAKDKLSVQVHPGEEYAVKNENDHGKTEAWYILDAQEGAELILGFKKPATKEEVKKAIENETLTEIVNRVKVKKGEIYFIPSGTLHAIGEGILICEIQQNSNVTYRLYDYGRLVDGVKRPLKVEKALDVLSFSPYEYTNARTDGFAERTNLVTCDIFCLDRLTVSGKTYLFAADSFLSLVCVEGEGTIDLCGETYVIGKGDSYFIPALSGALTLSGNMTVLETKIP